MSEAHVSNRFGSLDPAQGRETSKLEERRFQKHRNYIRVLIFNCLTRHIISLL